LSLKLRERETWEGFGRDREGIVREARMRAAAGSSYHTVYELVADVAKAARSIYPVP
jgi:hypothetical protein